MVISIGDYISITTFIGGWTTYPNFRSRPALTIVGYLEGFVEPDILMIWQKDYWTGAWDLHPYILKEEDLIEILG